MSAEAPDSRYLDRDTSWLEFNTRVLAQAEDSQIPLLERVKYCAIFSTNLDEFFQVRVASLKDHAETAHPQASLGGSPPREELRTIGNVVSKLCERQGELYRDVLVPALAKQGIEIVSWSMLDTASRDWMHRLFYEQMFPVLTPLAVDPGHPFPYISNLSLNLAVIVRDPVNEEERFARVKVPPSFPRFVQLPDGERLLPLEEVIAAHLPDLFSGMEVIEYHPFRVTRKTDLDVDEDDTDDLLSAVESELRRRRFGRAVRLEVSAHADDEIVSLLQRELEVGPEDTYVLDFPLDLAGLWAIYGLDRPELKDKPDHPVTQPALRPQGDDERADIFRVLRGQDILVHHPYDSFATSVEAFLRQAATDPQVLAIKQTLYRTSGDSPVVKALIRAAESGKQVAVLIELQARFDEQQNIAWAKALERAGVHVVYGLVGLKTHAKVLLVVRAESDGIRRYVHIGTGNYNPKTASLYEDLGLLTSDPAFGSDATDLFNSLTGYSRQVNYRRLITAPTHLRDFLLDRIAREASAETPERRVIMKVNSLIDKTLIDALYAASQEGVQVELIVRGICGLRPGIPGLSDNVRVRSIVGRYLEHSRIYAFGGVGGREQRVYFGSADAMPRNLDRRIEVIVPIEDASLRQQMGRILETYLADNELSWSLDSKGTWHRVREMTAEELTPLNVQAWLTRDAESRAHRSFDPEGIRSAPDDLEPDEDLE